MRRWLGRALAVQIVGLTLLAAGPAWGTEVHTLFDEKCQRTSGVLVHVDELRVAMVDLDGRWVERPRDAIASVVIHKTLENPLGKIAISRELKTQLRDVWVGDDAEPTFTGWTTAFFDDLFLYFDLEGQTHVLDPEEIRRLRVSEIRDREVRPKTHAPVVLAFPNAVVPCGDAQVPPKSVLPSRVVADRIKVGDYLGKLESRYLAQAGFEERTRVYAEPFVFDLASRVGFLYDPAWLFPFPLYFKWSSGSPYRFQSLAVVGNARHEWLPFAGPSISARSDVKSHFFNATFIGNLVALPAGNDPFFLSEPKPLGTNAGPVIDHSYNYVLLMGADWWRLSLSAGASYLATRIRAPGIEDRVLLAGGMSPTVRARYQGKQLGLRALYFRTRSSGDLDDALGDDDFEEWVDGEPPAEPMGTWRLKKDTVRLGATWKPFATIEVLADVFGTRGRYSDRYEEPLTLEFLELTASGEVAISFGRYVAVRGNVRVDAGRYKRSNPAKSDTALTPRFGGALEFVF